MNNNDNNNDNNNNDNNDKLPGSFWSVLWIAWILSRVTWWIQHHFILAHKLENIFWAR